MSQVSIYLNFPNQTEEAFLFYRSVFGGDFDPPGISRFGDIPPSDDAPPIPEHLKNGVMHVSLPVLGGFKLMGTDAPAEFGFNVVKGNNMYINLSPETRRETRRLFDALSAGGVVEQPLQDMFWGAYYGSCTDKYGIRWMLISEILV